MVFKKKESMPWGWMETHFQFSFFFFQEKKCKEYILIPIQSWINVGSKFKIDSCT